MCVGIIVPYLSKVVSRPPAEMHCRSSYGTACSGIGKGSVGASLVVRGNLELLSVIALSSEADEVS